MNIPNEDSSVVENSAYNPFPEPQTIPAGWDLSGMFSPLPENVIAEEKAAEQLKVEK